MTEKSVAHKVGMNSYGTADWPDGLVPWSDAEGPDLSLPNRTTGRLRSCGYCGSMHPADVAAAIKAGAKGDWVDWKYGFPHKAYFDHIPNPHVGMLESRMGMSNPTQQDIDQYKLVKVPTGQFDVNTGQPTTTWRESGKPAGPNTSGKFYSVHLQDATPEDRETIEQHLGLKFTFTEDGKIGWKPA